MEDSDLSLIEIAGEDDSLLRSTPHADDAYFFCSPLHPPRSTTPIPKESSCRDSLNKDNTSLNKMEEKKFSLHPQQMKRKKKGGYNLRKSLAWDRAFFEEEGVLNSEELSMITGSVNSSGLLSVIHEETSSGSESAHLQDLEEKLFKVIPGSTPKKDRSTGGSRLSKHTSPARDNAVPGSAGRRKVLSAHDNNRSGSKRSGCPRPMASASVKRPANVHTLKSATKEPTVSKLPVLKPVPCAFSKTSKNVTTGASNLKRRQIAHPANPNNTKTSLSNAKVGPKGKSLTASTCPTRRNVVSSVKSSPTKAQCLPITEAKDQSEVMPKQTLPSTRHTSYVGDDVPGKIPEEVTSKEALPSASHASYSCDDRLKQVAVPLPHAGVNAPHTQLRSSKPSGLRMPSLSLGFFNQRKASSLAGPHKSSVQSCKIPNLRHIGSVNSVPQLRAPSFAKMPKVTNTGIENINVRSSGVESQRSDDKYVMDQGSSLAFPARRTEIQGHSFEKVADASLEFKNGSAAEFPFFRCEDQANDDNNALKTVSRNLQVEDTQMLASDERMDEISDVKLITLAPDNWQLVEVDGRSDKPEDQDLSNPCYIGKQVYQEKGLNSKDCVLDSFDVLPEYTLQNNILLRVESKELEGNCTSKMETTRNRNVIPPVLPDCRSNEVEMVDLPNVDNIASVSEVNKPVVENHNLDTQFMDDIGIHEQACLELHKMKEDHENQRIVSLTAHNIKDTSSNCGDSMSQLNLTMQVEAGSAEDTIEHRYLGFNSPDLSVESSCHSHQLQLEDDIIFCQQDTVMARTKSMGDTINVIEEETDVPSGEFDDGKYNVQQTEQVNSCSTAEARILNWNPGDFGLPLEGRKSMADCHKYDSENCENIGLRVKRCDASDLQIPPEISKHKIFEEAYEDVDDSNNVTKEPLPGSSADQSSVSNCRYSVDLNNAHELSGCPDLRQPDVVAQVSLEFKPRSDLNETLLANNGSCKENEEIDELVLDRYGACGSETKCSNACKEVPPAIRDGRPDLGGMVDYSQLELAVTRSSMIGQSSESVHGHTKSRDTNEEDQAASLESYSSAKTTNEEDSVRTLGCTSLEGKSRSSLTSDQTSPSGSILQDNEVHVLSGNTLVMDGPTKILKSYHTLVMDGPTKILKSYHTFDDELQQELDDTMHPPEEKDAKKELKKSTSGRKQDGLVIRPPSHAVPFSDEWLAAVEAAGEEILTKKGGAVQNSPPNKSPPQLGPYSPVKRKQNQVIGPFDCTKYTNPSGSQ